MAQKDRPGLEEALRGGIRASIRNNYTAYGFSIMITATLAVLSWDHGPPRPGELFLLIAGAAGAFTALEAAVSGGFKHGIRGEPSDVLALGTAFNLISVAAAVGVAALLGEVVHAEIIWLAGPFAATLTFVLASGVELGLAQRAKNEDD